MLRCVALLVVAGVAVTRAEPEAQAAISCQECIDEMHKLAYIIKGSAADIEVEEDMIYPVLISNTCPGVPEGRLLPHAGRRGAGLLRGAPRQQLCGHLQYLYNIYTMSTTPTQYLLNIYNIYNREEFILKSCSNFYWHRDLG